MESVTSDVSGFDRARVDARPAVHHRRRLNWRLLVALALNLVLWGAIAGLILYAVAR